MSLVKSPLLTPEKLEANRANARKSQGPATSAGLERMRDSKIQHGAYSEAPDEVLRGLGEDPEEFQELLESLQATWKPADELQARLVRRLARAMWRLERSDRVQERMAVRRVSDAGKEMDRLIRRACEPYEERLANLKALAAAVAPTGFVTRWDVLDLFRTIYGEKREGIVQEMRVLFSRLLPPAQPAPDSTVGQTEPEGHFDAKAAEFDNELDERDEEERDPIELPDVPIALGAERVAAQEQLQAILQQEIEKVEAARERERQNLQQANTPYFRDGAIPPDPVLAKVVFRMEDSSFRQLSRLTDLLLKLKRTARAAETPIAKDEGTSHDLDENKGPISESHDVVENT